MIAIYKLYNMLAIYLVALSIEYMLAIYHNKTIPNRAAPNKPQSGDRHTGEKPLECSIHSRRYPASTKRMEEQKMSINDMDSKIKELRELRRMADELAVEVESITDSIKRHMDAEGVDTLNGTDLKVTYKAVTSSRLDTTALKKALPDLTAQFTKTTTARRFCIA